MQEYKADWYYTGQLYYYIYSYLECIDIFNIFVLGEYYSLIRMILS